MVECEVDDGFAISNMRYSEERIGLIYRDLSATDRSFAGARDDRRRGRSGCQTESGHVEIMQKG